MQPTNTNMNSTLSGSVSTINFHIVWYTVQGVSGTMYCVCYRLVHYQLPPQMRYYISILTNIICNPEYCVF